MIQQMVKVLYATFFLIINSTAVYAANVNETEPNDVFSNLANVTQNTDFTQAETPLEGDVYIGSVGVGSFAALPPMPTAADFRYNDIDVWVFDLHAAEPALKVHITRNVFVGFAIESLVLFQDSPEGLRAVASTGNTGLLTELSYNPSQDGRYYLVMSGANNFPSFDGNNNLALFPVASPFSQFKAGGGNSFQYTLQFENIFPATALYSLPATGTASQIASTLGKGSISWLLLLGVFILLGFGRWSDKGVH